MIDVWMKV